MRRALMMGWLWVGVLGCGAFQGGAEPAGGDAGGGPLVLGEVALTTEVSVRTMAPTEPPSRVFVAPVRQLYGCFEVRGGELPRPLAVSWFRQGGAQPLHTEQLMATGRGWMAAEYDGRPLEPGQYFLRLESEGQPLAEATFEVQPPRASQPATAGEATVTAMRLIRGARGGPALTVLEEGASEVSCTVVVEGAPAGTVVELRLNRAGVELSRTRFASFEGRRELRTVLEPAQRPRGLEAGLYRIDALIDGEVARSLSFTVRAAAQPVGPRVDNLVLTTAVESQSGRPSAPPVVEVAPDVGRLYLSFTFAGMPPEEGLEVRWLQLEGDEAVLGTTTFEVEGRGSLAASLQLEEGLEPGPHRAEVRRRGRVIGARDFTVTGPEPAPQPPEDDEETEEVAPQ